MLSKGYRTFNKICIVVAASTLPLIGTIYAADFGLADVSSIVNTYKQNSPRFERDFVGKAFSAIMRLDSAHKNIFGSLTAAFGNSTVVCLDFIGDTRKIADWNPGDQISVEGTIYDVTLGTLQLKTCSLHK
jgi:hypothetical protein